MSSEEALVESQEEAAVEQLHQLLLEIKDYLEDNAVTPKGQKLIGKVELVLENWDDDAFFGEAEAEDEGSDDSEDEALDDEDEGSSSSSSEDDDD